MIKYNFLFAVPKTKEVKVDFRIMNSGHGVCSFRCWYCPFNLSSCSFHFYESMKTFLCMKKETRIYTIILTVLVKERYKINSIKRCVYIIYFTLAIALYINDIKINLFYSYFCLAFYATKSTDQLSIRLSPTLK